MSDDKKDKDGAVLSAERARQLILARRARFMAAALAGLSNGSCEGGPQICLSVMREEDSGRPGDGGPRVCLKVDSGRDPDGPSVCLQPPSCEDYGGRNGDCYRFDGGKPRDAGSDAGDGGDGGDGAAQDAGPRVCLSIDASPPPKVDAGPRVCLSILALERPDDEDPRP